MTNIYDVDINKLIEAVAKELEKIPELNPPAWSKIVKTGRHKERAPQRGDWWHIRSAAVLRSIYKLGPIGTEKLRTKYGGKQRRGHKPARFAKGSGSIIRKVLQQLEKAELIKQTEKGVHKGRVITKKGQSLLDKTALSILKKK